MSSIFANLPLDTLDIILRHVRAADLASLCRVSRSFNPRALNALYRDVRLTNNRSLKACFRIIDDASLAARVNSFAIHSSDAGAFYGVIQETLTMLPHLRSLELFVGDASWILPVDSCPFQLHTFLTNLPYSSDIRTFMAGQRRIKNLTVPWASTANYFGNLEFLGLRYLTTLCAPFSLVEALVPGRPIAEVATFRDCGSIRPHRIRCLGKSTALTGITRLQINLKFLEQIGPELLNITLPSLSCLTVVGDDPGILRGYDVASWVSWFLTGIHALHCFSLRIEDSKWQRLEFLDFPFPSGEQDLQYFVLSVLRQTHTENAYKRVNKKWIRCSSHESAWVLAHSIIDSTFY
ncbi:hypothetical protein B0H11DRAFT_956882 [Mycena galericulata]|nr:hypothetical protein B0H11DRAFT_956882 [Mycena galericulata]